ncbi:MAG: response regulator [Candidatus Kapaibacterium sp.]|nr:MAG: response regulator [Candidatus Kapabacteria bacterium]
MKTPYILAVDDDIAVLRALERDLRKVYRKDYKVLTTLSAKEALETLQTLKQKQEVVALLLSDQRMPEMQGVDYLAKAMTIFPKAKRVLLTAYSDIEAAIKAINAVQLDYYLSKPWEPPEEKLYPALNELLEDWQASYKPEFTGLRVIGFQWSPKSHKIKDFLAGNLVPYKWLDVQTHPDTAEILASNALSTNDLPALLFEDGFVAKNPEPVEIASRIGLNAEASAEVYDVVIVGAGPSGLAAAVYGSSEGLKTLLVERHAPGGQAGTSSRIENYLGFPSGLSGAELTRRAITQATRLGAEFLAPQSVVSIDISPNPHEHYKTIRFIDGKSVVAKSIIIASGVEYRQLEAENIGNFTGAGVYYGAATTEANACRDTDVYIVGGGNSAGQAAMYLSHFAKNVFIVIRGAGLGATMSQYLIDQIAATPNIQMLPFTEIKKVCGEETLAEIILYNNKSSEDRSVTARALYIFIGAKPATDWVPSTILRNERGFLETGADVVRSQDFLKFWKLDRGPLLLETSVPGIFAAGDVRSGAMNRVASAVGEGSMAIKFVHEYLGSL